LIRGALAADLGALATAGPNALATADLGALATAGPSALATAGPNALATAGPNALATAGPNALATADLMLELPMTRDRMTRDREPHATIGAPPGRCRARAVPSS
jgi:hypothetical protein